MNQLMIDCPDCNGDGFLSMGDRHTETAKDVCPTCKGRMKVPARTGETPQTSAPLAIPRTDSATSTTGKKPWTFDRTRSYLLAELERLKADLNTIGEDLTDDQGKAVSWLDVASGRAANVSSVLTSVTAPAPSSPGVRALSEAASALLSACMADMGPLDEMDRDNEPVGMNGFGVGTAVTFGHLRRLEQALATHSGGQSAGQGAVRDIGISGPVNGMNEPDPSRSGAVAQALRLADWGGVSIGNKALISAAINELERPAPDSTRKGHVSVPLVPTEAMWRAFGTLTPEAFRQKWTDTLAAHQRVTAERDEARAEGDCFRAGLANGSGPCVYCDLSREDWAKCRSGFPGCGRADDAMLCPHFGAEMEANDRADAAEAALATANAELARLRAEVDDLTGALIEVRDHPENYNDGRQSYAVGWAFWNIQNIARTALARTALARAATEAQGDNQLPVTDPVVEAVRADLLRRSQVGLAKYGTPLSRTDLELGDWINHAYEEALDFANYLKRTKMELDGEFGSDVKE